MSDNALLVAALRYAAGGFLVLPVIPNGKRPATKHGVKDASSDPAIIRGWWEHWPDANIGIATGQSSNLVVLDVDKKNNVDGAQALRELQNRHGTLPPTLTAKTPSGGTHLYSKSVAPLRCSAGKLGPGIDVRADDGYVVVPPSIIDGKRYEWLNHDPIAELPMWLEELLITPIKSRTAAAGNIIEGQRNSTLASLAGSMRARGMTAEAIEAALLQENVARCLPPLPEEEVRNIANSIARYKLEENERLTDYGNAERLVRRHGHSIRYCRKGGGWMVFDGRRWVRDEISLVERSAKETVRAMLLEAFNIIDIEKRKQFMGWIKTSESENRLRAMVKLAESEPGIPLTMIEFDADPWLLNCLNGTLDLRTGELYPHRREDLITKLSPVEFDPTARLAQWEEFLNQATNGDAAFIAYLQHAVGYTLTGLTSEEKLFFAHGPAATGKTTFLEALKAILGDYAMTSDFETFLVQRFGGGVRNDIARLAGARMVAAAETNEGRRFDSGLVKQLTGGDMITARFLFHESFEFRPQFKLWLAANSAPRIDEGDSAMWRRMQKLPFEHVIPEEQRDPKIKALLSNPKLAGPAILAWAARGCLEWQCAGLKEPQAVKESTNAYRRDMDILGEWIEECCELEPQVHTATRDLYASFRGWAEDSKLGRWMNEKSFSEKLAAHGFERHRDSRTRGFKGIRVVNYVLDAERLGKKM